MLETAAVAPEMSERAATDATSWLEVDAEAYASNVRFFRQQVGEGVELAAVLKANAYGHGWRQIAPLALAAGADSFCVFSLDEALALRAAGFEQDVLVFGHVPLGRLEEAVAGGFRLALFNRETLERLIAICGGGAPSMPKCRVHLKLETGTYRHGVDDDDLPWYLERLRAHPEIALEGAYTHFANIEDTTDHSYAAAQRRRFDAMVARLADAGLAPTRRHAACTAAVLAFPDTRLDMVRLGIGQFGFWPSKETRLSFRARCGGDAEALRPVLVWKTRVAQLKRVPAGAFVGYGCSYQTTRDTRLAVLPVGYADGYDRRLSNQAYVLVRGARAPVRGRVCMNLIMVDVTDIEGVALEDEVVLLGRQGDQEIPAEHLAALIGTIHYEVTTRIHPALPRVVV